jgi:hypothetical protein
MVIKWFSWEDIKSGTGPKCRQYKITPGFKFFCLVAYSAILDVFGSDQTHFGAAQTHFGAWNRHLSVYNRSKLWITWRHICLGSIHLFWGKKKDGWDLRADNEKRKQWVLTFGLLAFRTLVWFKSCLRVFMWPK